MIRISPDMRVSARDSRGLHPAFDHAELYGPVTVISFDQGENTALSIALRLRGDHIVEAEEPRDGGGVVAVRGSGHHQPITGGAIGFDAGARALQDALFHFGDRELLRDGGEIALDKRMPQQEALRDLLQPRAIDQLEQISEPGDAYPG